MTAVSRVWATERDIFPVPWENQVRPSYRLAFPQSRYYTTVVPGQEHGVVNVLVKTAMSKPVEGNSSASGNQFPAQGIYSEAIPPFTVAPQAPRTASALLVQPTD